MTRQLKMWSVIHPPRVADPLFPERGTIMKAQSFAKLAAGLGVGALLVGAAVTPANADPADGRYGILVGVGSDTTQFVSDGLGKSLGTVGGFDRLASYDALGDRKIQTRPGGPLIDRPNGSGNGVNVLRVALGQTPQTSLTVTQSGSPVTYSWDTASTAGQVDWARSSSNSPAAERTASGVLAWVPFAIDAVTYATSPDSVIPDLAKGSSADTVDSNGVGTASLYSIYNGLVTRVVLDSNGDYSKVVNDSYQLVGGETAVPINAYIPQAGSGTRSFWIGQVGITEAAISAGTTAAKDLYPNPGGGEPLLVQEHDGAATVGDPGALVAFSIAQWITQGNDVDGVPDRRFNSELRAVNGQNPVLGAEGSYILDPSWNVITRNVYHVVPSAEVDNPRSLTNWMFAGTRSLVCSQPDVIQRYGFGLLTATTGPNSCGDTSNRAFTLASSSVSLSASATAPRYGSSFTVTASTLSNGNQGGVVEFYNGATKLGERSVAAGATNATWTINTKSSTTPATYNLRAVFVPRLAGIDSSESSSVVVRTAKAVATVKATASTVRTTVSPKVAVTVTVPNSVAATGKVTIKNGSKTLGTGTLKSGKVTVTLPKLKPGTYTLSVAYGGSATVAAKSTTVKLTVTK